MSDLEKKAQEVKAEVKAEAKRAVAKVKRSLSGTVGRVLAWVVGGFGVGAGVVRGVRVVFDYTRLRAATRQ